MSSRSMADIAYEIMKKKKKDVPFSKLWEEVSQTMGLTETQAMNKIASFYSSLMLDTRFTLLADNKWDLRERHTYNETHIDTSSLVIDDDEEDIVDDDGELISYSSNETDEKADEDTNESDDSNQDY
ncbi:DNA-directed RNA polymerase subunit delta [bioreactor metagenome]|uniref:RNAP delta factor n=1 Tax=bioreactor metagenome TaxID=1076179 RepID=A0A645DH55_9ZZZZ|nr:DNA-directed RNA polymerase subunit delta [Erysipelotrichaceae bacterium]